MMCEQRHQWGSIWGDVWRAVGGGSSGWLNVFCIERMKYDVCACHHARKKIVEEVVQKEEGNQTIERPRNKGAHYYRPSNGSKTNSPPAPFPNISGSIPIPTQ